MSFCVLAEVVAVVLGSVVVVRVAEKREKKSVWNFLAGVKMS